jgi:uncharacterized protein with von Willebrand factor type A (vWA) domain
MHPDLINKLSFRNGGTNFNSPLLESIKIMDKYNTYCDLFVIIFYTDGSASYPEGGIKMINESYYLFKFYGICDSKAAKNFE